MKIAVVAGKFLNFGANFSHPRFSSTYKEQTQKDLQDKIGRVVEELKKDIILKALFALNGVLEKYGKCVVEKSLNVLFKKGYEPRILNFCGCFSNIF